ncbi:MAG: hypothetical protein ABGZ17_08865 [Planctomycetaceae bacterium]
MQRMIRARLANLKYLASAVMFLVLAACACEVGLRAHSVLYPRPQVYRSAEQLLVRSGSTFHELPPLLSVEVLATGRRKPVLVSTNSLGIRGPEPVVPKPNGVFRILCLGDETVLGADVAESETFCKRLQALMGNHTQRPVEVINAGIPGFCPILSYLQFRGKLQGLQADVVLLQFDMSDVFNAGVYRRYTLIDQQAGPIGCPHPGLQHKRGDALSGWYREFRTVRWCFDCLGRFVSDMPVLETEHAETGMAQYRWLQQEVGVWRRDLELALEPIDALQELTHAVGAQLVVSVAPSPWQLAYQLRGSVSDGQDQLGFGRRPFDLVAEYLSSRQIIYLDASAGFLASSRPRQLFLETVPRLSAEGHAVLARQLNACLLGNVPTLRVQRIDRTAAH